MWKKRTASESAFSISMRWAYWVTSLGGEMLHLVGEQDGGLIVTEVLDEELAEGASRSVTRMLEYPWGRNLRVTSSVTTRQAEHGSAVISSRRAGLAGAG